MIARMCSAMDRWREGEQSSKRTGARVHDNWVAVTAAAFAVVVLATGPAAAQPVTAAGVVTAWPTAPYPVRIVRQPVGAVLEDLADHLGVLLQRTAAVQGDVVNAPQGLAPEALLDWLAARLGLVWFFDGVAIHVATREESTASMVDLRGVSAEQVLRVLGELGMEQPRFLPATVNGTGFMAVGGPPAYRQTVEQVVAKLAEARSTKPVVYRGSSVP